MTTPNKDPDLTPENVLQNHDLQESWADHMEEEDARQDEPPAQQAEPIAQQAKQSAPEREQASQPSVSQPRKQHKKKTFTEDDLPQEGPFVMYLANLDFKATKDDIIQFFVNSMIEDISLPFDKEKRRPKGYANVVFKDRDSLFAAVQKQGAMLLSRPIRVDIVSDKRKAKTVAERAAQFRAAPKSEADQSSSWRSASKRPSKKRPDKSWGRNKRATAKSTNPAQDKPEFGKARRGRFEGRGGRRGGRRGGHSNKERRQLEDEMRQLMSGDDSKFSSKKTSKTTSSKSSPNVFGSLTSE